MTIAVPAAGYDLPIHDLPPGQPLVEVSPCPVCQYDWAQPRLQVAASSLKVVVCPECGLGRLWPMPTSEVIASFYSQSYYGAEGSKFGTLVELLVRWVAMRRARFLSRHIPPGGRVLEVGCGRGVLLGSLADRGYEVHGVELNAEAFEGIDPRVQRHVAGTLSELNFPSGHFDEVIVWHVLEHLQDPRLTIREIQRVLKAGGTMVVAVPNYSSWQARWSGCAWFHLDLPRHLFHFPVEALKRLISDEGFVCTETHHFSLRQNPFGWVQSLLNRWTRLPRNGLYVLLQKRRSTQPPPFSRRQRFQQLLAWWLGMPIALLLSILEAAFRRGATIHVVARSLPPSQNGSLDRHGSQLAVTERDKR